MLASWADSLILTRREESLEDDFLWRQFLELERERPRFLEPMMTTRAPDFGVYRINRQALLVP